MDLFFQISIFTWVPYDLSIFLLYVIFQKNAIKNVQSSTLQWEAHHHNQRVAPKHHNQRKPTCSNEDPAQPKVNKQKFKKYIQSSLRICGELVPGPPVDTRIGKCSTPLYKMAQYLQLRYAYPPIYFKSPLNYLYYTYNDT